MNWLNIATLGPIGYLPASGTCATIVTLVLVYGLKGVPAIWYLSILAIIFLVGLKAADDAVHMLHDADPSCVVIDESIGTLITFIGIPINITTLIIGFLLFRFFDISKWFGITHLQQLPSPWGVIIDDVVAGLFSCLLLHVLHV